MTYTEDEFETIKEALHLSCYVHVIEYIKDGQKLTDTVQ